MTKYDEQFRLKVVEQYLQGSVGFRIIRWSSSGGSALLRPFSEALHRHVFAAAKLHADDTPLPVLAPGNGKTRTARLWTYVRDDRASGAIEPPRLQRHLRERTRRRSGMQELAI